VQFGERGFVSPVSFLLRSLAEEGLHGAEVKFFTLCGSFAEPSLWHGRQAVKDLARGGDIFLVPHRMILRHGFTPKGQGEVRSDLLGLAEVLGSIFVFEVVELRQAAEKVCLRSWRTRIQEGNLTEVLLGRGGCGAQKQQDGYKTKQSSSASPHRRTPF